VEVGLVSLSVYRRHDSRQSLQSALSSFSCSAPPADSCCCCWCCCHWRRRTTMTSSFLTFAIETTASPPLL